MLSDRITSCAVALLVAVMASVHPATAQKSLEARTGDGIWTMLRRAGVTPTSTTVREFKKANSGRFIHGDQLVVGRSYEVPANVRIEPLFGPDYERVEIKSDDLSGAVYYVVSGHGGPDPGSIGRFAGRDLPEDEIAYDVSLRLARRLMEEGATVYIIVQDPDDGIRDGTRFDIDRDEVYMGGKSIVLNQVRRLRDRAEIINRLYDKHRSTARLQRVISLHVDARGSRHEPQIDVHFQVASSNGQQFGEVLQATFRDQYDRVQPGRGYTGQVEHRNLFVLRETKPVAALVELGNIRHPRDQIRLTKANNRQALAEWLFKGLVREYDGVAV
jgi:N-acetylmuramoyl-L-alanine amidase